VRVVGVGLALVAGVEEPRAGRQLRGDVNDVLAVREQPLRQRPAGAVAALDRQTRSGQARACLPIAASPALSALSLPVARTVSFPLTTSMVTDSL
jgi:hypothetical protein